MNLFESIINSYTGYANYLWKEVTTPHWGNYFYWLLGISILFMFVEWIIPWRKGQAKFRKDFFIDFFYMFFNFFLFSLIIYNAASDLVVNFFNTLFLSITSIDLTQMNPLYHSPYWLVLLIGFLVRDFVQWWTHRLLHSTEKLWAFHKVHHSVREMGFAAHLRYHWMENVVYRTIEYLPLSLLGIGLYDFFVIHIFTLIIGHYNHSNFRIPSKITGTFIGSIIGILIAIYSFLLIDFSIKDVLIVASCATVGATFGYFIISKYIKYVFNGPSMHIWHHAKELPNHFSNGVNFGLTLSIWDYIFKTAYIPYDGRDIELGFEGVEHFPNKFEDHIVYGFNKNE